MALSTLVNEEHKGIRLYETNQWNDSESIRTYYDLESNKSAIGVRICLGSRYYYAVIDEDDTNEFTAVRVIRDLRWLMSKYRNSYKDAKGDTWSKIKIAYFQINSSKPGLFCISPEKIKGKPKDDYISFSISKPFLLGDEHSTDLCREFEGVLMSEARNRLILRPNRVLVTDFNGVYNFIEDEDVQDFIQLDDRVGEVLHLN